MPESKKIVLDTNFLLIPAQFGVDIFAEIERICQFPYKLCIVDKTAQELENILKKQRGKQKEAAKLALSLLKAKNINTLPSAMSSVDDAIVALANKQTIVATQDILLKRRLRDIVGGIITLRQKKYLIIA